MTEPAIDHMVFRRLMTRFNSAVKTGHCKESHLLAIAAGAYADGKRVVREMEGRVAEVVNRRRGQVDWWKVPIVIRAQIDCAKDILSWIESGTSHDEAVITLAMCVEVFDDRLKAWDEGRPWAWFSDGNEQKEPE